MVGLISWKVVLRFVIEFDRGLLRLVWLVWMMMVLLFCVVMVLFVVLRLWLLIELRLFELYGKGCWLMVLLCWYLLLRKMLKFLFL